MSRLLKNNWSDTDVRWLESDHQMAVARELRRHDAYIPITKTKTIEQALDKIAERTEHGLPCFTFAADQNANKRSLRQGSRNKAEGMESGEQDLRIYISGAKLILIELKRHDGVESGSQADRRELLTALGYTCFVVYANCPDHAVKQVMEILKDNL